MIGFRLQGLAFSYPQISVLSGLDLAVEPGERVALLGRNGSGKTTLLKLISGLLQPTAGQVYLDGTPLSRLTRRQVAQRIAVVPQHLEMPFGFTVKEMALLGRTPHVPLLREPAAYDRRLALQALAQAGVDALASRVFNELSGGERQRVILAMALAQEPRLLLLDEPTLHLDVAHQMETLELVRRLNEEQGVTIVAAIHDLNLASLFFHRLICLGESRLLADGSPTEVLTEEVLRRTFGAELLVVPHPLTGQPQVWPVPARPPVPTSP